MRHRLPVELLLDNGEGGGSCISIAWWTGLRRLGGLSVKISRCGRGLLYAANPVNMGDNVAPISPELAAFEDDMTLQWTFS